MGYTSPEQTESTMHKAAAACHSGTEAMTSVRDSAMITAESVKAMAKLGNLVEEHFGSCDITGVDQQKSIRQSHMVDDKDAALNTAKNIEKKPGAHSPIEAKEKK